MQRAQSSITDSLRCFFSVSFCVWLKRNYSFKVEMRRHTYVVRTQAPQPSNWNDLSCKRMSHVNCGGAIRIKMCHSTDKEKCAIRTKQSGRGARTSAATRKEEKRVPKKKRLRWWKRKPLEIVIFVYFVCGKQFRLCNAIKIVWDWLRRKVLFAEHRFFRGIAVRRWATLVLFKLTFFPGCEEGVAERWRKYQKLKLINYYFGGK